MHSACFRLFSAASAMSSNAQQQQQHVAQKRKEIEQMRQQWLREKRIEEDRQAVEKELGIRPQSSSSSSFHAGPTKSSARNDQQQHAPPISAEASIRSSSNALAQSLSSSSASSSSSVSASSSSVLVNYDNTTEEVINRLADRLTDRLRDELREEIRKESVKEEAARQQMGTKLERYLASEIEAHTCPICYELMAPPERAPMLLFPCGHSFCAMCLRTHARTQVHADKCPLCRTKIQSQASNISLQNLIENFLKRRARMISGENPFSPAEEAALLAANPANPPIGSVRTSAAVSGILSDDVRYLQEYKTFSMRCEVLRNEFEDLQAEAATLSAKSKSGTVVLQRMEKDEVELEEQIKRLTLQLEIAREQTEEQRARVEANEVQLATAQKRLAVVEKTYSGLKLHKDKAKLILRGTNPQLAAEECSDDDDVAAADAGVGAGASSANSYR
ncbi:conserved mitochondrial RING domain-containing protein [Andalucia godoyi]|uniref:Conserved mitochondrial RING domain-containing protein n=1 Tax=Andalucia godoyi TaxID=505711 RepID=A0A8K0AID0_ANDGO|nr:conserved mitochondrial RING domain-containing protein [Andalucia godoyi]|eukprot:ANDGO_01206.mRNA.1 conserved mitochondrial RING domain-containing protein